jgi:hypothetical protein
VGLVVGLVVISCSGAKDGGADNKAKPGDSPAPNELAAAETPPARGMADEKELMLAVFQAKSGAAIASLMPPQDALEQFFECDSKTLEHIRAQQQSEADFLTNDRYKADREAQRDELVAYANAWPPPPDARYRPAYDEYSAGEELDDPPFHGKCKAKQPFQETRFAAANAYFTLWRLGDLGWFVESVNWQAGG